MMDTRTGVNMVCNLTPGAEIDIEQQIGGGTHASAHTHTHIRAVRLEPEKVDLLYTIKGA